MEEPEVDRQLLHGGLRFQYMWQHPHHLLLLVFRLIEVKLQNLIEQGMHREEVWRVLLQQLPCDGLHVHVISYTVANIDHQAVLLEEFVPIFVSIELQDALNQTQRVVQSVLILNELKVLVLTLQAASLKGLGDLCQDVADLLGVFDQLDSLKALEAFNIHEVT